MSQYVSMRAPMAQPGGDKFKEVCAAAHGQLVILRPDGRWLLLPALQKDAVGPDRVAAVERMMPSETKRNVAVIGEVIWAAGDIPTLQAANQAIPFFGLLMGLATIGHSVWIFNGGADVLEAGCREADVLIVDSACLTTLSPDWQGTAARVMRNPEILVHDRVS
jgi:hypothetical protein